MKVADIVEALDQIASPPLAASWDNVGLLIGDRGDNAGRLMLCIDLTASVLDEARREKADMVMAYHPTIFRPVSRVTAEVVPIAYRAIRAGVAVYSMHTALDAVPGGFNDVLADILPLASRRPIEPSVNQSQCKIVTFVQPGDMSRVAEAAFGAGAGRIGNYSDCAFFSHGIGSFCPGQGANPAVGQPLQHEATEEMRLEIIAPRGCAGEVCSAIRDAHSYETPAIDVYPLSDYPEGCGLGRIGSLKAPASVAALISRIKRGTKCRRIWVAGAADRSGSAQDVAKLPPVKVAAVAAGACGDLFRAAIAGGATFLLTGEMRHHDALEASRRGMTVVCVGHSNSERVGLAGLAKKIAALLPGLPIVISKADRDPLKIV